MLAVVGGVDGIRLFGEALANEPGHVLIVFDEQDSHGDHR